MAAQVKELTKEVEGWKRKYQKVKQKYNAIQRELDDIRKDNQKLSDAFTYNGRTIRFRTPSSLERYTDILEWDKGYLVVMAKYKGAPAEEEYIDLVPILNNLYIDADAFLKPIRKVELQYA